ncbi:MAG: hypothetical protein ABI867_05990 [Kofleriaceae bacterium]
MRVIAIAALSTVFACSAESAGDDQPPTLEIFTPERGTTADSHDITVTGHVSDDAPGVRVTVNGVDTTTGADGNFSAVVSVDDGISVIETHAIDKAGSDVRDVRAVLAGTLASTDGTVSAQIGARVSAGGLAKVGTVLAGVAQALDWKALAIAMNPIYDSSGCNSAKLNIEDLTVGTIGVALVPVNGAITTDVTIDNVYVRMHANFRAVCISGSTTVTVRATRATINGDLALGADGGKLSAALPASTVRLDGFSLDVSGVPGAIESLLKSEARKAAEKALNNAVKQQVPPKASEALGGLLAQGIDVAILDRPTQFAMSPAGVDITPDGLIALVDAKVLVEGGEGGVYVSSPSELGSSVWNGGDLGVALADDVLNQLFSGLWASGAITPTLSLDGQASILAALLDDDARSLVIDMKLPPTVRANAGALELSIGDLIISVRDDSNTEIQQFALTIITSLSAAPGASGAVSVTVGTPIIKAQMLSQTAAVDVPMTDSKLEDIVNGAWGLVGGFVDDALANLPLPSVSGLTLGAPSLVGRAGFLVVDLPVQ